MSGLSFAVVATPGPGGSWTDRVRRLEDLGYDAVLLPDTLRTMSPFPALAAAAAVTERLRLRTWVLAAPLRTPAAVVRESAALHQLSDGRFELGIGTGRPDAKDDATRLGVAWADANGRIAQLVAVAEAVQREVDPGPPVVVTAAGPKALAAASAIADRIGLPLAPTATSADLAAAAERASHAAPTASLSMSITGIGEKLPRYLASQGMQAADLVAAGAVGLLPAGPSELARRLLELTAGTAIDEVVVPEELADDVAAAITDARR